MTTKAEAPLEPSRETFTKWPNPNTEPQQYRSLINRVMGDVLQLSSDCQVRCLMLASAFGYGDKGCVGWLPARVVPGELRLGRVQPVLDDRGAVTVFEPVAMQATLRIRVKRAINFLADDGTTQDLQPGDELTVDRRTAHYLRRAGDCEIVGATT
jgi:hypothetical protein